MTESYVGRGFSPGVTLTLLGPITAPLDMSAVRLDGFADLDEGAIAKLQIRAGRETVPVGDVFTVRGGRSTRVRIEGALASVHGVGTGLAAGELVIAGDVGDGVGSGMTGGRIHLLGNARHDAGLAMRGGVLRIDGHAGDRLGAAGPGARRGMCGGEIIVGGSVGNEAATRARRGLIVVKGSTGQDLARDIIAGTVVAFGRVGTRPGLGNKRGSIIAFGGVDVPSTYRLACAFEPAFVRLLLTYLDRQFGLKAASDMLSGRFRRYCGDAGLPGKGEILEWIPA